MEAPSSADVGQTPPASVAEDSCCSFPVVSCALQRLLLRLPHKQLEDRGVRLRSVDPSSAVDNQDSLEASEELSPNRLEGVPLVDHPTAHHRYWDLHGRCHYSVRFHSSRSESLTLRSASMVCPPSSCWRVWRHSKMFHCAVNGLLPPCRVPYPRDGPVSSP